MKEKKKTRLPKLLRELLVVVQFLVFFVVAVKLAFNAEFSGFIGRFTGEEEGYNPDVDALWQMTYEKFVTEIFMWFVGLCVIRFVVVMIWNQIRVKKEVAEKIRRKKSVNS